jgi:hypothetical protein
VAKDVRLLNDDTCRVLVNQVERALLADLVWSYL